MRASIFLAGLALASTVAARCKTQCSTTALLPTLPVLQTALSVPTSEKTTFVALGRGVQNYTCSSAMKWANIGAVARLFDVSCLAAQPGLDALPTEALAIKFDALGNSKYLHHHHHHGHGSCHNGKRLQPFSHKDLTAALRDFNAGAAWDKIPSYLGIHTFVNFPNATTIAPKFDFTHSQRNASAFVIGGKVGALASPQNATTDVAWLELAAKQGSLAKTVFRTQTAGGQAPSSCTTVGAAMSVPYAALYWFLE